jgi:hypothetical protein
VNEEFNRDKARLDIFCLRDESLEDSAAARRSRPLKPFKSLEGFEAMKSSRSDVIANKLSKI